MNFFTSEETNNLWIRDTQATLSYLRLANRHLTGLADPNSSNFFSYPFMCPPSYPSIFGRRLSAGFSYEPPSVFGAVLACRFIVRFEDDADVTVVLCGETLNLSHRSSDRQLRVAMPEHERTATFPTNRTDSRHPNFIAISAIDVDGRMVIAIDNKRFMDGEWGAAPSRLECVAGSAHLVQFQAYSEHDTAFVDFMSATETIEALGTNPYIPVWERQSNNLYHTFLLGAVLREAAAALGDGEEMQQDHMREVAAFAERLAPVAKHYLRRLEQFPAWRPSSGSTAEAGPWDWNSWAVGLMPGAYALCARILGLQSEARVQAIFHNRGANWLLTTDRFLNSGFKRLPGHTHWVRFSTNHGLVIYFGFLVGALVLGLEKTDEYKRVREQLRSTIDNCTKDGSYLEGLGYFGFAFKHGIPFFWLEHRARNTTWLDYVETELRSLARCGEWLEQANSSSGQPFANFGDNQPEHWRGTSLMKMLTSIQDSLGHPGLRYRAPMTTKSDDAYAPFARFMQGWPTKQALPEGPYLTEYTENGLAVLSNWKSGERVATAAFIGSKYHKTHNRNHDCGGFLLEARKTRILASTPRTTQLFHNNAVCALLDGKPVPCNVTRSYHGKLRGRPLLDGAHLIQTLVTYPKSFRAGFGLRRLRRLFLALADGDGMPALAVVSIVEGGRGVEPGLCFDRRHDDKGEFEILSLDRNGEKLGITTLAHGVHVHRLGPMGSSKRSAAVTAISNGSLSLQVRSDAEDSMHVEAICGSQHISLFTDLSSTASVAVNGQTREIAFL